MLAPTDVMDKNVLTNTIQGLPFKNKDYCFLSGRHPLNLIPKINCLYFFHSNAWPGRKMNNLILTERFFLIDFTNLQPWDCTIKYMKLK